MSITDASALALRDFGRCWPAIVVSSQGLRTEIAVEDFGQFYCSGGATLPALTGLSAMVLWVRVRGHVGREGA